MKVFYLVNKDNRWEYKFWESLERKQEELNREPKFSDLRGDTCFIFKFSDIKKEKNFYKKIKLTLFALNIFLSGKYYKIAAPFHLAKLLKSNLGKQIFIIGGGGIGEEIYRFHLGSEKKAQIFISGPEYIKVITKDSPIFKFLSFVSKDKKNSSTLQSNLKTEVEITGCYSPAFISFVKNEINPSKFVIRYFDIFGTESERGLGTIRLLRKLGVTEISSYHKKLCEEANITYSLNQVNYDRLKKIQANSSQKFDVSYFGLSSEDRDKTQRELFSILHKLKLTAYVVIRGFKEGGDLMGYEVNQTPLPYEDYLKKVAESRAVIDLWRLTEDEGYSYRLSEAMVMNKKIITNRKRIKEEPFYDPNRFFILGVDTPAALRKFLEKPIDPLSKEELKPFILQKEI